MDYFILSIIVGVIGFVAGVYYGKLVVISKMISLLSESELDELEKLSRQLNSDPAEHIVTIASKDEIQTLKQEVVDGQIFLYDAQDNFVCQGSTIENTVSAYELTRSGKTAKVINEDGEQYYIVSGKIQQTI